MKLVTAIIRPSRVDDVKESLKAAGVLGLTISEVQGFGRQLGHTEIYRGAEYKVDLIPKMKIEVLTDDESWTRIAEAIADAARTDAVGDGKIWTTDVVGAVRIRTGERGDDAI